MAQEFGVSRGTLRRALTTLIEKGLLRQVRGRGAFMTSTTIEPTIAQKRNPARTPVRCATVPVPVQARSDRLGPWSGAPPVQATGPSTAAPGQRHLRRTSAITTAPTTIAVLNTAGPAGRVSARYPARSRSPRISWRTC
ncbi:GntR family transcriptional regulator [Streptomyces anulatus]